MGFYGNIVNTNKTQFVFDRTYPNRYEMDKVVDIDGVFVGRFVLVDYDTPEGSYNDNYLIDRDIYPNMGRPYDSTVWQKVYTNGQNKYVMIAELNAVVPTFDLAVDPPVLNYITPHFDEDSTNIYYKLHMPAQWKVQVKEAESKAVSDIPDFTVTGLAEKDGVIVEDSKSYPADIYFGKGQFGAKQLTIPKGAPLKDSITLTPNTSGYPYPETSHSGSHSGSQPDIQELSVHLPSVGNTIAQLWNLAFGNPQKVGETEKNEYYERNTEIAWGNTNGHRLIKQDDSYVFNYNEDEMESLAGCINSVHDLMGQIITDEYRDYNPPSFGNEKLEELYLNLPNHIFVLHKSKSDSFGFYIIEECRENLEIISSEEEIEEWLNNRYDELYVYDDPSGKFKPGFKWCGTTDLESFLATGIKIGYRKPIYQWVELKGFAKDLNTIHGLIVEIHHKLRSDDLYTRDNRTVQGCINILNDIISKFDEIKADSLVITNGLSQLTTIDIQSDQWVEAKIDGDNRVLNIKHSQPALPVTSAPVENIALSYEKDSILPYPCFDEKGHQSSFGNISISKVPMALIETENQNIESGKIVTYIKKHPNEDGKYLVSMNYLVDIKLDNLPEYQDWREVPIDWNTNLSITSSLGEAIRTLESRTNELNSNVNDNTSATEALNERIDLLEKAGICSLEWGRFS